MEMMAWNVLMYFTWGDTPLERPKVNQLSRTLSDCRPLITSLPVTGERRDLARQVLTNIAGAADQRHRCVHDVWYPNSHDQADTWVRNRWAVSVESIGQKAERPVVSKAQLERTLSDLQSCTRQIDALLWCLVETLPKWEPYRQHPDQGDAAWNELAEALI